MPGRAFVDTNVLVYAVDEADPAKRDRARAVLADSAAQLVLSAQVLSEFYVVATRKLEAPLSEPDAAEAVRALARLPVVVVDAELVMAAVALSRQAQINFWDAQIVAAAAVAGCDHVLTEDLTHGTEISSVRIENPFR
jgi:predicted nucleic acid-binding protein